MEKTLTLTLTPIEIAAVKTAIEFMMEEMDICTVGQNVVKLVLDSVLEKLEK